MGVDWHSWKYCNTLCEPVSLFEMEVFQLQNSNVQDLFDEHSFSQNNALSPDELSQDILAMIPNDPETGLPTSYGSIGHDHGNCKPCVFMWRKGCNNGLLCKFCHLHRALDPKKEKRVRRALQNSLERLRLTQNRNVSIDERESLELKIVSLTILLTSSGVNLDLSPRSSKYVSELQQKHQNNQTSHGDHDIQIPIIDSSNIFSNSGTDNANLANDCQRSSTSSGPHFSQSHGISCIHKKVEVHTSSPSFNTSMDVFNIRNNDGCCNCPSTKNDDELIRKSEKADDNKKVSHSILAVQHKNTNKKIIGVCCTSANASSSPPSTDSKLTMKSRGVSTSNNSNNICINNSSFMLPNNANNASNNTNNNLKSQSLINGHSYKNKTTPPLTISCAKNNNNITSAPTTLPTPSIIADGCYLPFTAVPPPLHTPSASVYSNIYFPNNSSSGGSINHHSNSVQNGGVTKSPIPLSTARPHIPPSYAPTHINSLRQQQQHQNISLQSTSFPADSTNMDGVGNFNGLSIGVYSLWDVDVPHHQNIPSYMNSSNSNSLATNEHQQEQEHQDHLRHSSMHHHHKMFAGSSPVAQQVQQMPSHTWSMVPPQNTLWTSVPTSIEPPSPTRPTDFRYTQQQLHQQSIPDLYVVANDEYHLHHHHGGGNSGRAMTLPQPSMKKISPPHHQQHVHNGPITCDYSPNNQTQNSRMYQSSIVDGCPSMPPPHQQQQQQQYQMHYDLMNSSFSQNHQNSSEQQQKYNGFHQQPLVQNYSQLQSDYQSDYDMFFTSQQYQQMLSSNPLGQTNNDFFPSSFNKDPFINSNNNNIDNNNTHNYWEESKKPTSKRLQFPAGDVSVDHKKNEQTTSSTVSSPQQKSILPSRGVSQTLKQGFASVTTDDGLIVAAVSAFDDKEGLNSNQQPLSFASSNITSSSQSKNNNQQNEIVKPVTITADSTISKLNLSSENPSLLSSSPSSFKSETGSSLLLARLRNEPQFLDELKNTLLSVLADNKNNNIKKDEIIVSEGNEENSQFQSQMDPKSIIGNNNSLIDGGANNSTAAPELASLMRKLEHSLISDNNFLSSNKTIDTMSNNNGNTNSHSLQNNDLLKMSSLLAVALLEEISSNTNNKNLLDSVLIGGGNFQSENLKPFQTKSSHNNDCLDQSEEAYARSALTANTISRTIFTLTNCATDNNAQH